MASDRSYGITLENNKTENAALTYLLASDARFINPTKASRKLLMDRLGLDRKFSRAFDLVMVKGHTNKEELVDIVDPKDITLIELKTTKKKLADNPHGFFFGATENEFDLARLLGDSFRFCFVSLHPESKSHVLLSLQDLESMIKTKRVQYQINL